MSEKVSEKSEEVFLLKLLYARCVRMWVVWLWLTKDVTSCRWKVKACHECSLLFRAFFS